jgi:hypothetical protein
MITTSGITDDWAAHTKWQSLEYLKEKTGDGAIFYRELNDHSNLYGISPCGMDVLLLGNTLLIYDCSEVVVDMLKTLSHSSLSTLVEKQSAGRKNGEYYRYAQRVSHY